MSEFEIKTEVVKKDEVKSFRRTKLFCFCEKVIEAEIFKQDLGEDETVKLEVPKRENDKDEKTTRQRGYSMVKMLESIDPELEGKLRVVGDKRDKDKFFVVLVDAENNDEEE